MIEFEQMAKDNDGFSFVHCFRCGHIMSMKEEIKGTGYKSEKLFEWLCEVCGNEEYKYFTCIFLCHK